MARQRPNPKKLLVASVGVATLNYLPAACTSDGSSVANLMLGPPYGAGGGVGAGGGTVDSGADAKPAGTTSIPPSPTVANLMAPAPQPQNQSRSAPKGR